MNKTTYDENKIVNREFEVGQLFVNQATNEVYVLASLVIDGEDAYVLVCLNDGLPWQQPHTDINSIFGYNGREYLKLYAGKDITLL